VAIFITFEGGEGSGKSTQAKLLADRLASYGKDVILTREPGGTPQGEALRSLLVTGEVDRWSVEAEALLNYAARDAHLRNLIRPSLNAGKWVISDRFMDSTRAYQQFAGGVSSALVDELEKSVVGNTIPHLTFVFDLAPEVGLSRAHGRGSENEDRFERKGVAFHKLLRSSFLDIARQNPQRCKVIDAAQSIEDTAIDVWSHAAKLTDG
jgi:dTMP kinase